VGIGITGFHRGYFVGFQLLHVEVLDEIRWGKNISYFFSKTAGERQKGTPNEVGHHR
jgi:hypothetical protein